MHVGCNGCVGGAGGAGAGAGAHFFFVAEELNETKRNETGGGNVWADKGIDKVSVTCHMRAGGGWQWYRAHRYPVLLGNQEWWRTETVFYCVLRLMHLVLQMQM